MTDWMNVVVPVLTTVLGASLGYWFSRLAHKRQLIESEDKEKKAEDKLNQQNRLTFYRLMRFHLHASQDAFIDQCRIRNRLLRLLGHDLKEFDWNRLEEVLSEAYPALNDEQRNLFDFIRGITKTSLLRRNQEMLSLLEENPDHYHELSEFEALQCHLELWLAKFEAVLKKREDYCLVYVGVKEKKPFPEQIEQKVEKTILEMEEAS